MKLNKETTDIVNIGDLDSINSTIADENLGLALNMVSKNLYSNPIGSFIRELTSNAVDANVDADETSPILIHIYSEDNTNFIEVKDNGVGMSPETFKSIYMSWFNSDKRDTNSKIGGWGLGSKSPLAYQDDFEIITRYNGTKYHYVFAKEEPVPKATLLLSEPTEESNGTTIRVEIKAGDLYKVHTECEKQLVYFNNVYVKNEIYFYDNSFKIYEADKYKLRNREFPYGNEMHIVLGQVAYPINWNVLDIERVNIPVAIKFDIGDLEITLSKEELNYTEKVKDVIRERVEEVTSILIKKYEEQLSISDLFEYIKMIKDDNKPNLVIQDVSIPMKDAKASLRFTPFEGVKINSKQIRDIFSLYDVIRIKNGKNYREYSESAKFYHHLWRYNDVYLMSDKLSYFDSQYISNGSIFKRGKLTKAKYHKFIILLNLIEPNSNSNTLTKPVIKQGAASTINKVIKYIDNYLKLKLKTYEGTAPEDWIREQKEAKKEAQEKTKGEITYYDIYNKRSKISLKILAENTKIVFYIDKQASKKKVLAYYSLYKLGNNNFLRNTEFILISPTTITKVKRLDNAYPIETIFKVSSYNNLLHTIKLSAEVNNLNRYQKLFGYSAYYHQLWYRLKRTYNKEFIFNYRQIPVDAVNKESFTINILEYFKDNIRNVKLSKGRDALIYEEYIPVLKDLINKAYVLNYINSMPHRELVAFIKTLKITKLDSKYYDSNYNNY